MMKSYCFPSTYEFTNQELSNVANNLLDGIKIKINENDYIVGNLALRKVIPLTKISIQLLLRKNINYC